MKQFLLIVAICFLWIFPSCRDCTYCEYKIATPFSSDTLKNSDYYCGRLKDVEVFEEYFRQTAFDTAAIYNGSPTVTCIKGIK